MNVTSQFGFVEQLKHAGKFWYLVNPAETTFEFPQQVPNYQQQVWLPFIVLIVLENIILYTKKEGRFRLNNQIISLSHWIFDESTRLFFHGVKYWAYIQIYDAYHWWDLPWNSPWTWCLAAIVVDFCYYWLHRFNHASYAPREFFKGANYDFHIMKQDNSSQIYIDNLSYLVDCSLFTEVNFMWAYHQVHHSSEEFNLAVGLRQSILQHWCSFIFYLPLALFIPPSHFIAHHQFNLIYQLWIHTTIINDLGPLELIFNTPKHHRVHHGCNLYCLDTNYGGVLIIWDKLFGTFMSANSEETIYGLTVQPQSFNPLYLQTFYFVGMIQRSLTMKSLNDKLAVFWKGPSWFPSMPRLGLDEFKIDVRLRDKYDTRSPLWKNLYVMVHFCIILYNHFQLYDENQDTNLFSEESMIVNNIITACSIGLLIDHFKYANHIEYVRSITFLIYARQQYLKNLYILYVYYFSFFVWSIYFSYIFLRSFNSIFTINQRRNN